MVTPEVVGHIDPVCLVELKDEREAHDRTAYRGGLVLAAVLLWLTDLGDTS
jgi:hypothetical protein